MRVLQVLDFEPPFGGGIVQHLRALGDALAGTGSELVAAFPSKQHWFRDLGDHCNSIVVAEIHRPLRSGFAPAYQRVLREQRIDVAHLSFSFALPLALACRMAVPKVPVIYQWHNPPAALHTGPLAAGQRPIPALGARWIARFTDRRVIQLHLAVSSEIRDLLVDGGWASADEIEVLPNALSLDVSERRRIARDVSGSAPSTDRCASSHLAAPPLSPPNGIDPVTSAGETVRRAAPVIGSVANFRPQKDHDTLLRAFMLVLQTSPEARLVLVGDGPTRPEIESLIRELGLQDRVELTGFVDDPAEQYARFDVFILASHYEGQGIVLLEAMVRGIPVIATDLPAIRETVGPDLAHLLVPRNDPSSMARTLVSLLHDPVESMRIGSLGRDRVTRDFSMDAWCQRAIACYKRVATAAR